MAPTSGLPALHLPQSYPHRQLPAKRVLSVESQPRRGARDTYQQKLQGGTSTAARGRGEGDGADIFGGTTMDFACASIAPCPKPPPVPTSFSGLRTSHHRSIKIRRLLWLDGLGRLVRVVGPHAFMKQQRPQPQITDNWSSPPPVVSST